MSNYLLPCPACGQHQTVSAAQAGQSIRCACGQSIEIPTMRHLRQLQPAAEIDRPGTTWNLRKGLLFLGCAIMGLCAAVAGWYYSKLPRAVDPNEVRTEIDALEPALSYISVQVWRLAPEYSTYSTDSLSPIMQSDSGKLIHGPLMDIYATTLESRHPMARFVAPHSTFNAIGRAHDRKALSFWLPAAAAGALVGLLIALSALLVRSESPQRRPHRSIAQTGQER
ncbi:MAG: hypothetical protein IT427_10780 [Pirellulales bacterium]|nr:hypothetical protein [Pirellulales bacterium]